ncbi:MAG: glycosyltransferase family 2 protein [Candidatus Omnitrophica bacterium]|nr:glycosyltransferase family 2 protein [Candidatus Omnitrophota bacterium]
MNISIGIVSCNNREILRRCIKSIYATCQDTDFEVIVVDNNSSDRSQEMLVDEFPEVRIIENKQNLGFAKSVNQAIRQARGKFLFLGNEDIIFSPDCLRSMTEYMKANPKVGILGPKIINEKGTTEMSFNKKCSNIIRCILDNLFFYSYLRAHLVEKYLIKKFSPLVKKGLQEIKQVAWVSGAAFLLRKSATEKVGLMDESFFMYCEDEDFGCRMTNAGWQVHFFPRGVITHSRGSSTQKSPVNFTFEATKSQVIFYRKRYNRIALVLVKALLFYRLTVELVFLCIYSLFSKNLRKLISRKQKNYIFTIHKLFFI